MEKEFDELAEKKIVERTMASLKKNGINSYFVHNGQEAKKKVFELLPENAEVMNMSSETLRVTGIAEEIMSLKNSLKNKLKSMNRETQGREMQRLGAAPEYAIGSFHAVTQDGEMIIASNSGSQLPAHSYGSDKVIFVAGTQKIVKDFDEGMKRIWEYSLPLENERAKKAYGIGSFPSKILIINREIKPDRIFVIFVNEKLGF
jgi:hypothetical protein